MYVILRLFSGISHGAALAQAAALKFQIQRQDCLCWICWPCREQQDKRLHQTVALRCCTESSRSALQADVGPENICSLKIVAFGSRSHIQHGDWLVPAQETEVFVVTWNAYRPAWSMPRCQFGTSAAGSMSRSTYGIHRHLVNWRWTDSTGRALSPANFQTVDCPVLSKPIFQSVLLLLMTAANFFSETDERPRVLAAKRTAFFVLPRRPWTVIWVSDAS